MGFSVPESSSVVVDLLLAVVELIEDSSGVVVVDDLPVLEVMDVVVKLFIDVVPIDIEDVWIVVAVWGFIVVLVD